MENEIAEIEEEQEETESKAEKKEREKWEKAEKDYVQGRLKGKTIQELSDKLYYQEDVCLQWEWKHRDEIKQGQFLQTETLLKKKKLSRNDRIESFSVVLEKINKEIAKRDFKDLPTDKLIMLGVKMTECIKTEIELSKVKIENSGIGYEWTPKVDLSLE